MRTGTASIVWLRLDLRLADNPALRAALLRGGPVVPVFVWAPEEEGAWPPGGASRWWLHQSLERLAAEFRAAGSELVVRRGGSLTELLQVAREADVGAVFWNRRYEPATVERDASVKAGMEATGLEAASFNGALLREPWELLNRSGRPFQVFTPFWKACLASEEPEKPLPAPRRIPGPRRKPRSIALNSLGLDPQATWTRGLSEAWRPGTIGAAERLKHFLADGLRDHARHRDRPDLTGTSRLSPHLHFGEISVRQVWHATRQWAESNDLPRQAWRGSRFLAELGWREFAHHLLHHFPHTAEEPLRREFSRFPWRTEPTRLRAWQRGRTGYPLVDAGMRELWTTGWMHNRVRMVVASFLVKNLLIPWQEGARWFWDTLVDADLANNTLGWQWSSGCGADAAPYFRIFNPVRQGLKFDPDGNYVRRWVPELAALRGGRIHEPWAAAGSERSATARESKEAYPERIVGQSISREVALDAYARMRRLSVRGR